MSFYSRVIYSAGGAGSYAIPFPYIDQTHIHVLDNGGTYAGTIGFASDTVVTLTPDISAGHTVEVRRITPGLVNLVSFAAGSIASEDMNLSEVQLLYLIQELTDGVIGAGEAVAPTRVNAQIVVTGPGNALTVGDGLARFSIPADLAGKNLVGVMISLDPDNVSSSGLPTVQIRRKRSGVNVDMLSTRATIDVGEKDSTSAATPAVIGTPGLALGDDLFVDVDGAGTGAKDLNVNLTFDDPS